MKLETQTLVKRPNFFNIKYSKSNKRTFMICSNGLHSLLLERNLGDSFFVQAA